MARGGKKAAAAAGGGSSGSGGGSSQSGTYPAGWAGFRAVEEVAGALAAEDMYARFVRTRMPVVLRGGARGGGAASPVLADADWVPSAWSVDGLRRAVGGVSVAVEHAGADGTFGTGVKTPMTMAAFLDALAAGATNLYLTTQPLPDGPDGLPAAVVGAPITQLAAAHVLPLRPAMMGHLVPSTVNLWIGRSAAGTSSNLHHDYHDNLYVLVAGRKRFTLSPPSSYTGMYMHGTVTRLHPNGVINYLGVPTREDGAPLAAVVEARQRELDAAVASRAGRAAITAARDALAAAQAAATAAEDDDVPPLPVSDVDSDDDAAAAAAPAASKKAAAAAEGADMWAAMAASAGAGGGAKRGGGAAAAAAASKPSRSSDGATGTAAEAAAMWAALTAQSSATKGAAGKPPRGKAAAAAAAAAADDDDSSDSDSDSDSDGDASPKNPIPPHFSTISLPRLRQEAAASAATASSGSKRGRTGAPPAAAAAAVAAEADIGTLQRLPSVRASYPAFASVPAVTVELAPGDALFLPAGWFHEVVSLSGDGSAAKGSGSAVHTALNFWYHPASTSRTATFEQPYADTFWQSVFARQTAAAGK